MKQHVEQELVEIRAQRDAQVGIYNDAMVNIHRLNGAEDALLAVLQRIEDADMEPEGQS